MVRNMHYPLFIIAFVMIHISSTLTPLLLQTDKDPTSSLGANFDGLDAREKRDNEEKNKKVEPQEVSKYMQD